VLSSNPGKTVGKPSHPSHRTNPWEDLPPDYIESLYDDLEDPADAGRVLANLNSNEAGWLARHISDRIEKERASFGDEIESELKVFSFSMPA